MLLCFFSWDPLVSWSLLPSLTVLHSRAFSWQISQEQSLLCVGLQRPLFCRYSDLVPVFLGHVFTQCYSQLNITPRIPPCLKLCYVLLWSLLLSSLNFMSDTIIYSVSQDWTQIHPWLCFLPYESCLTCHGFLPSSLALHKIWSMSHLEYSSCLLTEFHSRADSVPMDSKTCSQLLDAHEWAEIPTHPTDLIKSEV